MARRTSAYDWQRAIVVTAGAVLAVVVIGALYWARAVLIPVALAVFLSFLLGPLVTFLQARGLRRGGAVFVAVLAASMVIGGAGWVVTRQMFSLVDELQNPKYTENIKGKIRDVREFGRGLTSNRLGTWMQEMSQELQISPKPTQSPTGEPADVTDAEPTPVVVQEESSGWLAWVAQTLASVTDSLAGLALAAILVVFMLLNRESLRDRLIRLAGKEHLTTMTKAVDDAAQRISRFLLVQFLVNSAYGLALSFGLLVIGVPYALLWGFLAALLRYIPYIGPWIAAIAPILLSVAGFDGWTQPLVVLGLIVVLELVTNNVLEPLLYGHSMGVSEVALLVAAAFWTFLWGPIGLVLSSPLTVCLVVLGKHVPQLAFFDILLGDEPGLSPRVSFYQRLLAHDRDEATEIAMCQARSSSLGKVYEGLLLPALSRAKQDRRHGELTDDDEQFIIESVRPIVTALGEQHNAAVVGDSAAENSQGAHQAARVSVLACPARDEADRLALEMLRNLLDPLRWELTIVPVETLAAELVRQVAEQKPAIVCIGSLPPSGVAHTRYLCKRLRTRFPELKLMVARLDSRANLARLQREFRRAGADHVETTLRETRKHLSAWLPVLAQANTAPGQAAPSDHAA